MGKKKNKNELLLVSIFQNTRTALQSIENILPNIKSTMLKKELKIQSEGYKTIAIECEEIANETGSELADNNFVEKIRLWSAIKMNTLTNKSTRHTTEMLLYGTFMGITQCLKDFADYQNCDKKILKLLKKLQILEESNLENLKIFL